MKGAVAHPQISQVIFLSDAYLKLEETEAEFRYSNNTQGTAQLPSLSIALWV